MEVINVFQAEKHLIDFAFKKVIYAAVVDTGP